MKRKGMHKEDIKAAIRKGGETLANLGLQNGLSASTCASSLYRPCPSANAIIAGFLGKSLHELWPTWYDQQGRRITRHSSRRHSVKKLTRCHRQKSCGGLA